MQRLIESACIVVIATPVYLVLGEMGVRLAIHAPLFSWQDFRRDRAAGTINHLIEYDAVLGWRLKSFIASSGFNTLEYGFRSNGEANSKVMPGGVLAVGSSFTAGSGVSDAETWPAHLQRLTGWNVNNAGRGGYQADQIILLGEELLPLIRPQVLVVDLMPDTIIGTGYASSGWAKPYFTIEDDALVLHNSPVPRRQALYRGRFDIKKFLGHFASLNQFMAASFPNFWFTVDGNDFATVRTDEVGVTCRLLARLKKETDTTGTRLILYLQYSWAEIVQGERLAHAGRFYLLERGIKDWLLSLIQGLPPGAPVWHQASAHVGECARSFGITTVDEMPRLIMVYEGNADELRKYYQLEPSGRMGHKTSLGNKEVAKRIAAAIGELNSMADLSLK